MPFFTNGMNKSFAITSTAVFGFAILCSVAVLLYAGMLSGWNTQLFWALVSKTLFLYGLVLPIIGIPLSWHILRAPTRVEQIIEGAVLLAAWIASVYVIYTTISVLVRVF